MVFTEIKDLDMAQDFIIIDACHLLETLSIREGDSLSFNGAVHIATSDVTTVTEHAPAMYKVRVAMAN